MNADGVANNIGNSVSQQNENNSLLSDAAGILFYLLLYAAIRRLALASRISVYSMAIHQRNIRNRTKEIKMGRGAAMEATYDVNRPRGWHKKRTYGQVSLRASWRDAR